MAFDLLCHKTIRIKILFVLNPTLQNEICLIDRRRGYHLAAATGESAVLPLVYMAAGARAAKSDLLAEPG